MADTSSSLEETNKLRIKLGLAPLIPKGQEAEKGKVKYSKDQHGRVVVGKLETVPAMKRNEHIEGVDKDEFGRILVETDNIGDKKHQDKIRQKLETRRNKRKLEGKLKNSLLGASTKKDEDDELDMASWVKKQAKVSKVNKKRHQMLEKRYEEEYQDRLKAQYTSKDMKGLKVQHDLDDIDDERDMILTLKDKKILDEDVRDVLHNVNIVESENARMSIKNKLQGKDYAPWRDQEAEMLEDTIYLGKRNHCLKKYDEIVHGSVDSESFTIGKGGEVDTKEIKEKKAQTSLLWENSISLKLPEYKLQNDYAPVAFKKPKKSKSKLPAKDQKRDISKRNQTEKDYSPDRKVRKREPEERYLDRSKLKKYKNIKLRADDLTVDKQDSFSKDLKSANGKQRWFEDDGDFEKLKNGGKIRDVPENKIVRSKGKRKTRYIDREAYLESVANDKEGESEEENENNKFNNELILTTTEEFCRSIKNVVSENTEETTSDKQKPKPKTLETLLEDEGGYSMINVDGLTIGQDGKKYHNVTELIGITEESTIDSGIASFLKLAREKGVLDERSERRELSMKVSDKMKYQIKAQEGSYHAIDDRFRYDHDIDRLGHRRLGNFDGSGVRGQIKAFKDKVYQPTFQLSYADENGIQLDPKEAFRKLSHKFHGKTSGKIKTEKRSKKMKERTLACRATYNDKSIMMDMLNNKKAKENKAFVVLAGQSQDELGKRKLK